MSVDIKKCERCGKDHTIDIVRFINNPVRIGSEEYWYWGICKNTDEPVIMKIVVVK